MYCALACFRVHLMRSHPFENFFMKIWTSIVWFSIKVTTLNSNFLMVYSSENILFLYLHFTWLYGSWNHQRILKKHPFWKYDSWFSSELWKPSSVKYETWSKDIFCFHESIFQWHNELISHRSQVWHLRRKTAVIFSKWMFFQNSLVISWAI